MRKILFICLSVLFSLNIFGQEGIQYVTIGMDIYGIEVGSKVTYKDIVSRFGIPDKFKTSDSEFGMTEDYYYKKNWIHCEGNGYLVGYNLIDNQFPALTKDIKGGIRVGDELKKLSEFKYGVPKLNRKLSEGREEYMLYEQSDDHVYLIVKNGIIVQISCSYMD